MENLSQKGADFIKLGKVKCSCALAAPKGAADAELEKSVCNRPHCWALSRIRNDNPWAQRPSCPTFSLGTELNTCGPS